MPLTKLVAALALGAALLTAVSPNGTIVGTVLDPSGLPVAGARLIIRNPATNATREAETAANGEYFAAVLPAATYEVAVEAPNFRRAVREAVKLDVGETVRVDFRLELGEFNQSITVEGAPALVQADRSGLGQVIDGRKLVELPLNERNFLNFALLVPGAHAPSDGSQNSTQGAAVSVNGAREQANNYLLDGIDNNDQSINIYAALPSVDAIQEFQVHTSNYSAEFGRNSGAQVNVVLKSGTNTLHGSAFWFGRNRHLDAKNFFDLPDCTAASAPGSCGDIPGYDRHQFGATAGGPLRKDKTFLFGSYEQLRQRQAITRGATVPSQADRRRALEAVPAAARNPAGEAVLGLYPAANAGDPDVSNLYVAAPVLRNIVHQGLVKLDHRFSDRDSFAGHYTIFDQDRFNPYDPFFAFTSLPGFGSSNQNRGQSAAGAWIRAFSPRAVQEVRFGYSRLRARILQENSGLDRSREIGFPTLKSDPVDLGYPNVSIAGFAAIGEPINTPQERRPQTVHVSGTLALNPEAGGGRHQLKFGGEARLVHLDFYLDLLARGWWEFYGGFSGNPLQDLLRGTPELAIATAGNTFTNLRTHAWNFFVQDDIRLHPRLVLNAGLRYEYNSPPVDTENRLSVPDVSPASAACSPQPDCQYIPAGSRGLPRSTFSADRNNFAPRIGFAWRASSSGRTVLRGAYGLFFDVGILNANAGPRFNPPFFKTLLFFNSGTNTIEDIVQQPNVPIPTAPASIAADFRQAYMQHWNLTLQYAPAPRLVIETGYVGSKGTALLDRRNLNQPRPGEPPPFPQFGGWQYVESGSSSSYHAALVRIERRLAQGFELLGSYTFSQAIDNASSMFGTAGEPAFPQNSRDMRAERGLANFHARHRMVTSFLYQVPVGAGRRWAGGGVAGRIFANWELGGIVTLRSGQPFTVNRAIDQSGTGAGQIEASDRPDVISDPYQPGPVSSHPDPACHATVSRGGRAADLVRDPASWFNPCAFAAAPGRFGDAGRNALLGPGLANLDLILLRDFPFDSDRRRLQFRFEFFNLFNHPNFDLPDRVFDSPTFGRVLSANAYGGKPPRQIQLGLKYIF
jgi:hypothetical protein